MNSLGALFKIIEQLSTDITSNNNLTIALLVFVFINLLSSVLNILFQFKLKNKEKEINGHNLREIKRIEIQEELYSLLENSTYYDGNKTEDFLKEISDINFFLTKKRLYLTKKIIKITQEFNDYNTGVLCDYRTKNYNTELEMLEKYNLIFNNV